MPSAWHVSNQFINTGEFVAKLVDELFSFPHLLAQWARLQSFNPADGSIAKRLPTQDSRINEAQWTKIFPQSRFAFANRESPDPPT